MFTRGLFPSLLLAARVSAAPVPAPAEVASIALYPQASEFREVLDLSGLWDFKVDPKDEGERLSWWNGLDSPRTIAVPGSWNEQIDGAFNYLGPAWYFRRCQVPRGWKGDRVFLRVGSANYGARVWVNDAFVGAHEGGHLPFAFEVTRFAVPGRPLAIAIRVENELKPTRVPAGNLPPGQGLPGLSQGNPRTTFDFFPYSGLHRAVEAGRSMLDKELDAVHAKVPKPVVLTEFGADTLAGNHSSDALMWSEEFQVEFLRTYLDVAATRDFVVGMQVWNLADFRTSQGIVRPASLNHKGVFTRDREPKMAAHFLRERWFGKSGRP